jgi:hypothetical protein
MTDRQTMKPDGSFIYFPHCSPATGNAQPDFFCDGAVVYYCTSVVMYRAVGTGSLGTGGPGGLPWFGLNLLQQNHEITSHIARSQLVD